MRIRASIMLGLLIGLPLLVGCTGSPQATGDSATGVSMEPAVFTFSIDRHADVHAAAVEVLREHGFRIARDDFRFGVITTYPKESPTFAEFWIDDATSSAQARADTLNAQQRTARLEFRKAGEGEGLTLTVKVTTDRLQKPARYLTHSATGQLSATYSAVPTHLARRGIDGPYAQPLTSDPLLERRLIKAIRAAVSE